MSSGLVIKEKLGVYALVGIAVEVAFWALWVLVESGDLRLHGCSHLWAIPIYSVALLAVDILSSRPHFTSVFFPLRGIFYTVLVYSWELVCGLLLKAMIGACPWDYSGYTRYHLMGIVTLDYFPFWLCGTLTAEKILIPTVNQLRWKTEKEA